MIICKTLKNKCGVYIIQIGSKFYIGSSKDLYKRLKQHKYQLAKNKHFNKYLQNLFNKYQTFSYKILEFCDVDSKLIREEYYISLQETVNNIKYPTQSTKELLGKTVSKIDVNESFVTTYKSISDLAKELNLESNRIVEALRLRGVFHHSIFYYTYLGEEEKAKSYIKKAICQIDLNNNIVNVFHSLIEANKVILNGKDALRYYINKNRLFKKQFYFKTLGNI